MKRTELKHLTKQVKSLNAKLTNALRKTYNHPHFLLTDGSKGIDFYMESYAGDKKRFPDIAPVKTKDGKDFTEDDKLAFQRKYGMFPYPNPFYGIKDGKVYQFNPATGRVDVSEVGKVTPYGDELPEGWQNYAKEV